MLPRLRIRLSQKLALAAMFVLTSDHIICDVLRTYYTFAGQQVSLTLVWSMLEPTIAVVLCALPVYRSLLPQRPQRIGRKKPKKAERVWPSADRKPIPAARRNEAAVGREWSASEEIPGYGRFDMLTPVKESARIAQTAEVQVIDHSWEDLYLAHTRAYPVWRARACPQCLRVGNMNRMGA